MQFVDANVFIRYLTGDDPKKAERCFSLFQQAKRNKVNITTSETVIAEVVYVLSSSIYNLSRKEIVARLQPLLTLPGLKLLYRDMFIRSLAIYAAYNIDFEDCLSVAHMEHKEITEIYTYDMDFDKFNALKRIEP